MESGKPRDRILIVEDAPAARRLYETFLVTEGYDVAAASTAEEALASLKEFRPDLILMDVQLPGMDGLALARRLKSAPETRGSLIVAITAFNMTATLSSAMEAGCDAYLTKPISLQSLVETMGEMLAGRRAGGN